MSDQFVRTLALTGAEGLEKLKNSKVLVAGIGGVGGYTAEALVRAGVGHIDIVDMDTVSVTNINRQIIALHSTVGRKKVDVMRERMLDINPNAEIRAYDLFIDAETISEFDLSSYSYVADAIDTVSAKLMLIRLCHEAGTPIISSMGTGNKTDPTRFRVDKIKNTQGCPLARIMRKELRKMGLENTIAVWSPEEPVEQLVNTGEMKGRAPAPGTLSFVPSAAGLVMAGHIIRELAGVHHV
ncbi:MAG: tRNA threonylcarbamoyladenosine dehydratase [Ruminococcaceae bacterium]|nr:tRNA threonylcarbamoyladenosine dehydratase [Oscillospiraceae bacterium]